MKIKQVSKVVPAIALALFCTTAITPVLAGDITTKASQSGPWAGTKWLIRGRLIDVAPDESNGLVGGAPAPLTADNSVMPELDFTYFFNDNIAAELILAVSPHDVKLGGTVISDVLLLPPTLTLQYHHPMGAFKPYVGAGVNYTAIISSDPTAAIGGVDDWDSSFGFALQAGFDYALDDKWSINMDVKKLWLNVDATVTAAAIPASVDLDPWIFGVGVGYRF
jgi:outer membrane protein